MKGILLIAHGSIQEDAADSLKALARAVQERLALPVLTAFLGYTAPSIPEGVRCCYERGIRFLYVQPYFLSEGFLMKKAVNMALEACEAYPDLQVVTGGAIGFDERLTTVMLDRYREAIASHGSDQ